MFPRHAAISTLIMAAIFAGYETSHAQDSDAPPPPDEPLAIPAGAPVPEPRPPRPDRAPDGDPDDLGTVEYRPSANAPKQRKPDEPTSRFVHADIGYRLIWTNNALMPIRTRAGTLNQRPHMLHATVGGMLDKSFYMAGSFEAPINRAQGTFPFVAEARFGWWDNVLGEPERRGAFGTLSGVAVTYIGARWVSDYYRGRGQEWAGTGDAGGLVLGYLRSAPFGKLTVVSDSQFSLYLLGWKERPDFPLGLLNQRISVGFDPVFLDARFRMDPALGEEWSVGLSMQSLF